MTPPPPRLIALGASNLTRGFLALADVARADAGGPVEILAALGRGRSYGMPSRMLGRGLCGIDDCELWTALGRSPRRAGTALLMDVGNDILYGSEVARILHWVESALVRLSAHAEHLIVAGLPVANLERLGPARFALLRTVLVPGCRLSLAQAEERARSLEQGLQELAARHRASFRPLRSEWYGLDPLHFLRRARRDAFASLLGASDVVPAVRHDRLPAQIRFLASAPSRRWWFGHETRTPQPALRWHDGTSAALY